MRLRFILPALLVLLLGSGFVYALVAIQSGKKGPSTVPSALIGKSAPEFSLPAPGGIEPGFASADLNGKATAVHSFPSSRPPCHVEQPLPFELAKETDIQLHRLNSTDNDAKHVAWFKEV